nr:Gfo/Idh/MocA family oxidoreductase [uncultured Sphaerochaeta sp.]
MNLVIVGCGGMGWYQAKKFQDLGAQIVGAIDHNEDHLRGFCENFGVEESYKSLDMISRFSAKANALSCCLPDCFHTLCCEAAVRANLAIFCEKPLTSTQEEADFLARLPKSRPFMINFSKRHTPSLSAVQDALSRGLLGTLENVTISYLQSWYKSHVWGNPEEVFRWKWRLLPEFNQGGCLSDLGSHLLDLLFLLFGNVHFEKKTLEVTPNALVEYGALLRVGDNTPCTLHCSYQDPTWDDSLQLTIEGSEATLTMNTSLDRKQVVISSKDGTLTRLEGVRPVSTYQRFYDAVGSGTSLPPSFEDGYRVQKLLEEMR